MLIALTLTIWILLYVRRVREQMSKRIHPQKLASRTQVQALLNDDSAANNFSNLLEMPVLFYVLVALVLATDTAPGVLTLLAWVFVGLRIAHSMIHVTYNKVLHRFYVYVAGGLTLWSAWAVFAWQQMGAAA
ncbi:MAG: MAPEG family protein [Pseudomonadota bacterium]